MASKEFSNTLKKLRIRAGYSQKQVYEHFGIPQSTFSSWEVGKSEPSGDMLIKLCEYYKCDMMKEFSSPNTLLFTNSEQSLIKKYRGLDDHGRDMVDTVLEKEYDRCKLEKKNNIVELTAHDKSYLEPVAAHERTDIEVTNDMVKHDDDIMDDPNF